MGWWKIRFVQLIVLLFLLFFVFLMEYAIQPETFDVKKVVHSYEGDPFEPETFDPWCCPSTYSSSQGCLCESSRIVCLLASRGGNRMLDPL